MRFAPLVPPLLALAAAGCAPRAARAPGHALAVVPADAARIRAIAAAPGARATLVNVWATWCEPCREEFPDLLDVAREHRSRGLRLVLVSADFDDALPAVRRFLAAHGVADTTYLKTGADQAFIDTLEPRWSGALPATLVYGRDGRLVAFWEGRGDRARFERAVAQALADTPATGGTRP